MRIMAISAYYPPDAVGGYEWAAYEVLERLRARGHEVRVLAGQPRVVCAESPEVRRLLFRPDREDPTATAAGKLESIRFYLRNFHLMKDACASYRPDVLYMWGCAPLTNGVIAAAEATGVPTVFHLEDGWVARLRNQVGRGWTAWLSRLWRSKAGKLPEYDASRWGFVYVSESMRRQYEAEGFRPGRHVVIHNGADAPPACRDWTAAMPETRRLAFAGRLRPNKGLGVLLDALALLRKREALAFRLDVCGAGLPEHEAQFREQADRLGLSDLVTWRGGLPREEMIATYADFDLACVPSLWEEPFGLVVIEALAAGVPVLASNRGALPEIVTNDVGWTAPPAPEAWAEALASILPDEEAIRARGLAAPARVAAHFRWDDKVDAVEAFLDEMAESGGSRQ